MREIIVVGEVGRLEDFLPMPIISKKKKAKELKEKVEEWKKEKEKLKNKK